MTLSARGVLWLFLTGAVPAGAVFLTCTGLQQQWQMDFSRGHRAPRLENLAGSAQSWDGVLGVVKAPGAQPCPRMMILGWSKLQLITPVPG